jgi:hypothetical protein
MKNLRQLCAATFLMLVITASVLAGDMQTTGITTTPPAQQTSTTGDIQAPSTSATAQMETPSILDAYPATEIAMTLMLNVISVF